MPYITSKPCCIFAECDIYVSSVRFTVIFVIFLYYLVPYILVRWSKDFQKQRKLSYWHQLCNLDLTLWERAWHAFNSFNGCTYFPTIPELIHLCNMASHALITWQVSWNKHHVCWFFKNSDCVTINCRTKQLKNWLKPVELLLMSMGLMINDRLLSMNIVTLSPNLSFEQKTCKWAQLVTLKWLYSKNITQNYLKHNSTFYYILATSMTNQFNKETFREVELITHYFN